MSTSALPAGASSGFRISYDAALVEEGVLLGEGRLLPLERAIFRAQRNRIYDVGDPDEREARFEELHGRLFLQLGLDRALHEVLTEYPDLLLRARGCRVVTALTRQEEIADVRAELDAGPETKPTIVVRLRPQSLLEAERLRRFLRRELLHVEDMLDPGFGYVRELPGIERDPAALNLLRERYRVVWDVTVDGRLSRQGLLESGVREARRAEFVRAFSMLGDGAEAAFGQWFQGPRPDHAAIVVFIQEPRGPGSADAARCPLCRLPAPVLERGAQGIDPQVLLTIQNEHPGWLPEHGRCARCAEVYGALLPTPG